jgi:hypothetical protein
MEKLNQTQVAEFKKCSCCGNTIKSYDFLENYLRSNFKANDNNFILVSKVNEIVKEKFPNINVIVLGKTMKKIGIESVKKNVNGKTSRYYFIDLI